MHVVAYSGSVEATAKRPMVLELPGSVNVDALCYIDPRGEEATEAIRELVDAEKLTILGELTEQYGGAATSDASRSALLGRHYLAGLYTAPFPLYGVEEFSVSQELSKREAGQSWTMPQIGETRAVAKAPAASANAKVWGNYAAALRAAVEYADLETLNLELAESVGKEVWVDYMNRLEKLSDLSKRRVEDARRDIEAINKRRKTSQIEASNELRYLSKEEAVEHKKKVRLMAALSQLEEECETLIDQCTARGCLPKEIEKLEGFGLENLEGLAAGAA